MDPFVTVKVNVIATAFIKDGRVIVDLVTNRQSEHHHVCFDQDDKAIIDLVAVAKINVTSTNLIRAPGRSITF